MLVTSVYTSIWTLTEYISIMMVGSPYIPSIDVSIMIVGGGPHILSLNVSIMIVCGPYIQVMKDTVFGDNH